MKKHSKLIRGIGLAVLLAAVFLSLSLNDVVRLNPQMEGVKDAQAASTAKQTDVDETIAVLVSPEGVPETIEPAEATETWNAEGLETIDADGDGTAESYVLTYEKFAALGGTFAKDKFGAPKTTEVEGTAYLQGKVSDRGNLWAQMSGWAKFVCTLAPAYLPLLVLGAALFLLGALLVTQRHCEQQGVTLGRYLAEKFAPRKVLKFISDNAIIVGILLLAAGVSIMRPNFLSEANFRNLLSNTAVRFIIAVGVSGCLITKGTDLSAGRMAGFAACISAILLQRAGDYANKFYPQLGNLPILPVLLLVLAICAVIGAINGTVIARLKVPPFIATLGMQTLVYGVCLVYTGAQPIGTLQTAYTGIALGYVGNRMFSYIAIIAIVVGCFMWFLYNKTRYGKYMYAIGGNETAAEVAGINTTRMKIKIYMLAAILYGLTGFLMTAKSGGASVNTAQGYELEAIAGCTIGGVSVNGGVGTIPGILVGVLVFEVLKIVLQFLGVESSYTYVAQGLVIIIAVALDLRKYLAKK